MSLFFVAFVFFMFMVVSIYAGFQYTIYAIGWLVAKPLGLADRYKKWCNKIDIFTLLNGQKSQQKLIDKNRAKAGLPPINWEER